jgi:hypothetical protein
MEQILRLLASDLSFLYRTNKFRIIDSEFVESFGGSAFVTLANENLKVRLVQSRDGLNLEFAENRKGADWYSFEIIRRLVSSEECPKYDGRLNPSNLLELKQKFGEVILAFSKEKFELTKKLLLEFERERSKRLFK